jgi:hypothetical protein
MVARLSKSPLRRRSCTTCSLKRCDLDVNHPPLPFDSFRPAHKIELPISLWYSTLAKSNPTKITTSCYPPHIVCALFLPHNLRSIHHHQLIHFIFAFREKDHSKTQNLLICPATKECGSIRQMSPNTLQRWAIGTSEVMLNLVGMTKISGTFIPMSEEKSSRLCSGC